MVCVVKEGPNNMVILCDFGIFRYSPVAIHSLEIREILLTDGLIGHVVRPRVFLSHGITPKSSIYRWFFHNKNHPLWRRYNLPISSSIQFSILPGYNPISWFSHNQLGQSELLKTISCNPCIFIPNRMAKSRTTK